MDNEIKFVFTLEYPKKVSNNTIVKQRFLEVTSEKIYKQSLKIYTDGSKTENGAGAAFYIPELDIRGKFSLQEGISSYSAELIAILQATFTLATIRQKDIIIFSDSQAAITALSNVYNYSKGEGIPTRGAQPFLLKGHIEKAFMDRRANIPGDLEHQTKRIARGHTNYVASGDLELGRGYVAAPRA
ncbi:hypothetical protein J6590_107733, partial [Homalodisca vitripennis]